jgi:ADP-ribose pyrophosphatase YjhB (NUDIX family)
VEHRIRAAGILTVEDKVLLLKVKDFSGEYWIPPGGGFETGDSSTKDCLRREFFEEAGIKVEVGELLCVREFLETTAGRYHAEFFYHITDYQGEPHLHNLRGLNDEGFIQGIEWVAITALKTRRTYPTDMSQLVDRVKKQQYSLHLGSYVQGHDETINHL